MKACPAGAVLRPLKEAPLQAYLTDTLQIADILEWILAQTGRADITMTSFSISEEFIRRLWHIRRAGAVRSFRLLLDHKATQKTISLWTFIARTIEKTYLADNHSKILLVHPADPSIPAVAVVTSQNLTRGNRAEAAVLTTLPAVVAPLLRAADDIINLHSVPLDDLLAQRLGTD